MYTVSKKVVSGCFVSIRGNKIIVCNKMCKARGIYTHGGTRITIAMDGTRITTNSPQGIVVRGPAQMKVS